MQIVKTQLLQESADENVRNMIAAKTKREASMTRLHKPSKLNTVAAAQVQLDLRFPTQTNHQELGHGNFKAEHTTAETRTLVSVAARSFVEDTRVQHAQGLAMQGVWTKWQDKVIPFDLSWKNLIYGQGPELIKFVLNATVNWVKTPDLLKLWGYTEQAYCKLCKHPQCTLHHIICDCRHSLHGGRYTWRHDSILLHLKLILQELVDGANTHPNHNSMQPIQTNFVRAGERKPPTKTKHRKATFLDGATDWKLLVEIGNDKIVYPPEIFSTSQRPDFVIWSKQTKRVLNGELTSPAEEGIQAAQIRKEGRYSGLENAGTDRGWASTTATIEVGARGFVARTLPRLLKRLGRCPKKINSDCKAMSSIAARCTYTIYLARESLGWDTKRELLTEQRIEPKPQPERKDAKTAPEVGSAPEPATFAEADPKPKSKPEPTVQVAKTDPDPEPVPEPTPPSDDLDERYERLFGCKATALRTPPATTKEKATTTEENAATTDATTRDDDRRDYDIRNIFELELMLK
jgi:hypothetical protein